MNKNELVTAVAQAAGTTKDTAQKSVDAVISSITTSLKKGNDVRLVGFGTFTRTHRAAKQGRNPQTGATIQIPAAYQAKFKAGKALKDAVNKK